MKDLIKTHTSFENVELYSVGSRHYLGCRGTLYKVSEDELIKALEDMKDMNPKSCSQHLVEEVLNNKFMKLEY